MTDGESPLVDVFLSYAREDRRCAEKLAHQLEASGFRVWWDFDLIGGQDYRTEIVEAIDKAAHVVVLWSENSVRSHFVIDEAGIAKDQGKLVPVLIGDVTPPLGFGGLHTVSCGDPATDSAAVIAALRFRPGSVPPPPRVRNRRLFLSGLAGFGVVAAGVGVFGSRDWLQSRLIGAGDTRHAGEQTPVSRLALVVGNGAYRNVAELANPVNDARAIADRLAQAGFGVALLEDSSGNDFREAIRHFKILLSLGGVGVFYYAGHAAHIDGRDLVLPIDAPAFRSAEDFVRHAIDITEVRSPIKTFFSALDSPVRHAGFVFVEPSTGAPSSPGWENVPELESASPAVPGLVRKDHGVMTVYAASRGELAYDGTGDHSFFAAAVLEEMGVGEGDVVRVARRVRQRVIDVTDSLQRPVLEDETTADFYFNRPDRDPRNGVLRLLFIDGCRDNPFANNPQLLRR